MEGRSTIMGNTVQQRGEVIPADTRSTVSKRYRTVTNNTETR